MQDGGTCNENKFKEHEKWLKNTAFVLFILTGTIPPEIERGNK